MADRWIVSAYEFVQQRTLAAAQSEVARLSEQEKKKKFRIYRIKTHLDAGGNGAEMIEAGRDIVALWKAQNIKGASRAERNTAIEAARERLIAVVEKMDQREADRAARLQEQAAA